MTRRKVLLVGVTVVVLVGSILGGIQVVGAIQGGDRDPNTDMTKSVARITYNGAEICTGSVVGDRWVLTAWHCLYGDLTKPKLDWGGFNVQLWQAGVKDINHPDWYSALDMEPKELDDGGAVNGNTISNDVTLMHTKKTMPDWAKTIPTAPKWPDIGTALIEYGYGNLNHPLATKGQTPTPATPAKNLQKSRDGSIVRTDCPKTQHWLSGHLCTAATQGFFPWEQRSLAWPGDSGGPLLWSNNGYLQQVGSFSTYPVPDTKKEPDQYWRSFWSEADTHTRNWILSWVFSRDDGKTLGTPPLTRPTDGDEAILRDRDSGASWLYVKKDGNGYQGGYRYWIRDGGTYNCLINNGVHVIDIDDGADKASKLGLPLRTIEALPDMKDHWASCTPRPAPTSLPAPTVTPTSTTHTPPTVTPPPPPTVTPHSTTSTAPYETAGPSGGDTFTNPANAGAPLGQHVAAYQTIKMSCRLTGWKAQDGNTWWYKIASSPWNNAFYAPADNYYNNGQTSGSLIGTPWVDTNIPICSTPPPPPPHTYAETAGPTGGNTFTNPANAGAPLGQHVAAYQTIQVSCRLTGFKVADGNTWWYRIASSPWNNAFYAPADNYYNNGQTSGSLSGTPFVDTAVPMC